MGIRHQSLVFFLFSGSSLVLQNLYIPYNFLEGYLWVAVVLNSIWWDLNWIHCFNFNFGLSIIRWNTNKNIPNIIHALQCRRQNLSELVLSVVKLHFFATFRCDSISRNNPPLSVRSNKSNRSKRSNRSISGSLASHNSITPKI